MIGKSDKIFTVSQDSKDKIKHLTNKEIHLIPPVIDSSVYFPIKKIKNNIFTALFVGRIDPEKNLEELIEYINNIKNFKLLIVGDGIIKKSLEDKYSYNKNILFVGKFENYTNITIKRLL